MSDPLELSNVEFVLGTSGEGFSSITCMAAAEAGGAEILSSIALEERRDPLLVLGGPARTIFARKLAGRAYRLADPNFFRQLVPGVDTILTGTSYTESLERNVIEEARGRGIRVFSFLDHWIHYDVRFKRTVTGYVLPDEIWVGDTAAQTIARDYFPSEIIKLRRNPQFNRVKLEIERRSRERPQTAARRILFLGEPISQDASDRLGDRSAYGFDEVDVAREVIAAASAHRERVESVVIRPHPADPEARYDALLDEPFVTISRVPDFIDDIARADLVVGIETIALLYAALAGKHVYALIPVTGYPSRLPTNAVTRLSSSADLGRIIDNVAT